MQKQVARREQNRSTGHGWPGTGSTQRTATGAWSYCYLLRLQVPGWCVVTALVVGCLVLVVITALVGYLVVALIVKAPRPWHLPSTRLPVPPPPLTVTEESSHWTALDDQQLARYLKESPE